MLSAIEIAKVNMIDVSNNKNIKSLTGIEYFSNLDNLYCDGTSITSLDVSNNINLETLWCNKNEELKTLKVNGASALVSLDCSSTSISNLDVNNNTNLETLYCQNNKNLKTLNVSGAVALDTLECSNTSIISLDVSNNNLIALNCMNAPLTYLNLGTNMNTLLYFTSNVMLDLDVTENTFKIEDKIKGIDKSKITIQSGASLDSETGIVNGYKHGIPIVYEYDCGIVKGEKQSLTVTLYLSGYSTSLEINKANFPDATFRTYIKDEFDKDGNNILSAAEIARITTINITGNKDIVDLTGIEKFTNLMNLYCSNTGITKLDISNNTELIYLYCNDIGITRLDVSNNLKLLELDCGNTKLNGLDVSNNSKLKIVWCDSNSLAYLNLGENENLEYLSMPASVTINLKKVDDTFNIEDKFAGIDLSKITIKSGAKYDSETGTVSDYNAETPIVYEYDCGTAGNLNRKLTVTLNITFKEDSSIEITENLDKTYDEKPVNETPKVTTSGSTGAVTYRWEKKISDSKWGSIKEAPMNAGTYRVTATVASDDNYKSASTTNVFTISKADSSIVVTESLDKVYNGTAVNKTPTVTTKGSSGEVTYTWEKQTNDSKWESINEAPTNAGTYRVTAIVASDDNYKEASSTPKEFTISQAENSWMKELDIKDWTYGKSPVKPNATSKYGTVSFTYSDSKTGVFKSDVPENAGTWYVKASV